MDVSKTATSVFIEHQNTMLKSIGDLYESKRTSSRDIYQDVYPLVETGLVDEMMGDLYLERFCDLFDECLTLFKTQYNAQEFSEYRWNWIRSIKADVRNEVSEAVDAINKSRGKKHLMAILKRGSFGGTLYQPEWDYLVGNSNAAQPRDFPQIEEKEIMKETAPTESLKNCSEDVQKLPPARFLKWALESNKPHLGDLFLKTHFVESKQDAALYLWKLVTILEKTKERLTPA